MEEKIIIAGEFIKSKMISGVLIVLSLISFVVSISINDGLEGYSEYLIFPQAAEGIAVFFWLAIVFVIFAIYFIIEIPRWKIVVTDKRVYGKLAFGRSIDLPYDKISSVGTGYLNGVFIATSSGLIKFILLTNKDDVYQGISDLLKDRQNKSLNVKTEDSSADEIKKFKELLDSGAITQEEYDTKKRQLLGL